MFTDLDNSKMRNSDRILVLETMEGKNTMSSKGLIDNRLFTGDNSLHAVMDEQTSLWYLKYDKGTLEQNLKQKFTSFAKLKKHVEDYFKKRNIRIKEVLD